ncbi:hypothetical protein MTR_0219s0020 [Medicago truncatula]|uniref:Uncharacterized protein n=1 Tax=Medicago truncatula TaxID=3880 RepID=A0A072TFR4_MEDTR|nr:hypothetical protein MTR_0219s0020 [Medicago truncatula]
MSCSGTIFVHKERLKVRRRGEVKREEAEGLMEVKRGFENSGSSETKRGGVKLGRRRSVGWWQRLKEKRAAE